MNDVIYSLEAEAGVIGGLLADSMAWDDVCEIIAPDDFYHPNHRLLFNAIGALIGSNQPVDSLTLAESLPEDDLVASGGLASIMEIIHNVPVIGNIKGYALIVKDKATLRMLQHVGRQIALMADSKEQPDELVEAAEAAIYRISDTRDRGEGPVEMGTLLEEAMSHIDALCNATDGLSGMTTGFREIDEITTGLKPGNLIIVAGRPAMGKSAFMMNLAEAALLNSDGPVLAFSLEMSRKEIMTRNLAGLARVNLGHLNKGTATADELQRIATATTVLHDKPFFIDESGYLTTSMIRARARRVVRTHGPMSMIVVDYLQLMSEPGKENKQQEISEISRKLKAIAKEFKCPVVAGSQLNRGVEQRPDKRPLMSDLRESGAIEQDADIVMALYRDEVYHEDSPDRGIAEVLILKQRNGPIGRKKLAFMGMYTRFEDVVPEVYSQKVPQTFSNDSRDF